MERPPLTLEQLPAAFSEFLNRFDTFVKQHSVSPNYAVLPTDSWFTLDELCDYLPGHPAKATIYGKVSRRAIPHKKDGKRLIFKKSEIDEWLNAKVRKTVDETQVQADQYLGKKKRRKK